MHHEVGHKASRVRFTRGRRGSRIRGRRARRPLAQRPRPPLRCAGLLKRKCGAGVYKSGCGFILYRLICSDADVFRRDKPLRTAVVYGAAVSSPVGRHMKERAGTGPHAHLSTGVSSPFIILYRDSCIAALYVKIINFSSSATKVINSAVPAPLSREHSHIHRRNVDFHMSVTFSYVLPRRRDVCNHSDAPRCASGEIYFLRRVSQRLAIARVTSALNPSSRGLRPLRDELRHGRAPPAGYATAPSFCDGRRSRGLRRKPTVLISHPGDPLFYRGLRNPPAEARRPGRARWTSLILREISFVGASTVRLPTCHTPCAVAAEYAFYRRRRRRLFDVARGVRGGATRTGCKTSGDRAFFARRVGEIVATPQLDGRAFADPALESRPRAGFDASGNVATVHNGDRWDRGHEAVSRSLRELSFGVASGP
ncbi:hypothetical protein EVAR_80028_1 [Eumeta japonica]|uniref:Uncharacterized protein n=1 Tax=Eumeta variegata TaxID=151549 RepID=A0A4C1WLP2_EUMVA|nr:hypothetical protein EVAR_80028_1 [Eumeta japonica]